MNAIFDTSALVPVFYSEHESPDASIKRLVQLDRSTGCCGAH